jgi:hypothetical protein
MSQTENTPPAFFKAPTVTPTPEVFKAVLVYQRAKDAFKATDAAFKRTKAGYLRKDDYAAHTEAARTFYRDAYEAWKTIHAWSNEVAVAHATSYYQSMVGCFLSFANDHTEACDTSFIKSVNAHIHNNGQHISCFFYLPCTPDMVDVAFGKRRYKASLRIGQTGIDSVDFYEIKENDKVSGFHDVSARMTYRDWAERFRHPLVKVSNDEMSPSSAQDYAELIKEAATLASALTDFNNLNIGEYDLHKHREDMIAEALTVRLGYFDEPRTPDAQ